MPASLDTLDTDSTDSLRIAHPPSDIRFPQTILNVGFAFALVLAASCLVVSGVYLFTFLRATNSGIEGVLRTAIEQPGVSADVVRLGILARTAMARFALLSCGVCVGMGFGFLGFGLFLLGIKGEMDVSAQHEQSQVKIARMAPGIFVILCATILIGVCITFRAEFDFGSGATNAATGESRQQTPQESSGLPIQSPGESKP